MTVVVDPINTIMSYGGTLIGGTVLGYAMSYLVKKVLKLIILVIGGIVALMVFLQYKGWISAHWDVLLPKLESPA
jgi:uncharacterized membrane protein (Fun14 family)